MTASEIMDCEFKYPEASVYVCSGAQFLVSLYEMLHAFTGEDYTTCHVLLTYMQRHLNKFMVDKVYMHKKSDEDMIPLTTVDDLVKIFREIPPKQKWSSFKPRKKLPQMFVTSEETSNVLDTVLQENNESENEQDCDYVYLHYTYLPWSDIFTLGFTSNGKKFENTGAKLLFFQKILKEHRNAIESQLLTEFRNRFNETGDPGCFKGNGSAMTLVAENIMNSFN